jgi:hypothetical protein
VSPALAASVQVSLSQSKIAVADSVVLTWLVLNAFSDTMQQCYAIVQNNPEGAGRWSGLQAGQLVGGVYSGSATITPTAAGTYSYALTCGGIESGFSGTLIVGDADTATQTTLSTNGPVLVGSLVALSAAVKSQPSSDDVPTGSVTFSYQGLTLGTVALTNGSANLNAESSGLASGAYPVTASYSGDGTFASSSTIATLVLLGNATTTSLSVPQAAAQSQPITLTSAVQQTNGSGVPTGTVSFYSIVPVTGFYEQKLLGSAQLNKGIATLTVTLSASIPIGIFGLIAKYSGDEMDAGSISGQTAIAVVSATKTTLTAAPTTVASGRSVTLASTVSRVGNSGTATGTVTFYDGATALGMAMLSGGSASLRVRDR